MTSEDKSGVRLSILFYTAELPLSRYIANNTAKPSTGLVSG